MLEISKVNNHLDIYGDAKYIKAVIARIKVNLKLDFLKPLAAPNKNPIIIKNAKTPFIAQVIVC